MPYTRLPSGTTELEEQLLELWRAEDTFGKSLRGREGRPEFVFYEGPPTANGRPGVHHIISRTIKDAVARYRSMTGSHVTRIAGWDTHGLPVEIEAEKKLGISGKNEIEELGIEEFNRVCRDSLFTYKADWENLSQRIGYWLDYAHPYITCSREYVESVWWALRKIHDLELLYRGYKVLPYCPRCGTGLSSHEVAQGYADVSDPSVTVLFPVAGERGRFLLVWTTTPWTLVSNVSVAFGPELEYVAVKADGREIILAAGRVDECFPDGATKSRSVPAAELRKIEYDRPLSLYAGYPETKGRLYPAEFVSDEDGTGLVHIAPAFGADDFELGQAFNLPVVRPVDDRGHFEENVELVGGQFVKDADPHLIELLRERGLLFRKQSVRHSYPHCWRCDSPLIYMARDSWYVRTTAVKDRLTALNAAIDWHPPEMGTGRMGEWLANNVDWALSRDRYWGTPMPVWVCEEDDEHWDVLGSYAELADRVGPLPQDFDPHRPGIDEWTWACRLPDCTGTMRRIPQVMDAWFDSGSMPYAQWHYPFENKDEFELHFPADFIAEGIDQTRGWFYSLLALSTILFDESAYRSVVVNDLILDAAGQKMSKSRGNVVDPWTAIGEHGADAIRFYLLSSSNPWLPKRWDPEGIEEVQRKLFDTLRNTYHFFALYADAEGWNHEDSGALPWKERPAMDRWLLSRLDSVTSSVRAGFESYELTGVARTLVSFVLDDLSNWYVRRSRDRFWATRADGEKAIGTSEAFATLHEVLETVALLLAPLAPFLSDWLHRQLADGDSAHLAEYPSGAGREDAGLEQAMADARQLAALGRAAREEAAIKVRQPLRALHAVIPGGRELDVELVDILEDELNVKRVVFLAESSDLIRLRAKPDFGALGPRFGSRTPQIARALESLDVDALRELRDGREIELEIDGEATVIRPDDVGIIEEAGEGLVVGGSQGYLAALDRELDDELRGEGIARELVSRVQRLRRDSGLDVSDRIELQIEGVEEIEAAAVSHREYIAGETLAVALEVGGRPERRFDDAREVEIEGSPVRIGLLRVERGPTAG